jgi:hypothetical protein
MSNCKQSYRYGFWGSGDDREAGQTTPIYDRREGTCAPGAASYEFHHNPDLRGGSGDSGCGGVIAAAALVIGGFFGISRMGDTGPSVAAVPAGSPDGAALSRASEFINATCVVASVVEDETGVPAEILIIDALLTTRGNPDPDGNSYFGKPAASMMSAFRTHAKAKASFFGGQVPRDPKAYVFAAAKNRVYTTDGAKRVLAAYSHCLQLLKK